MVHVYKQMASQDLFSMCQKTVQLHTTRSWSFLEHQYNFGDSISATSHPGSNANGSDIIIVVIDSGTNVSALIFIFRLSLEFKCFEYYFGLVLVFGQNLRALWMKVWVQFRNDGEELVKKRRNSLLLAAIGTCILFIMYSLQILRTLNLYMNHNVVDYVFRVMCIGGLKFLYVVLC